MARAATLGSVLLLAFALLTPADVLAQTKDDTLVYALQSDVQNWDPPNSVLRESIILGYNVFDHLAARDLKTGKVGPSLAVSWKNLDDTTWEVKLRKGVKFHDGTPFGAKDVKATFDRVLNPENKLTARGNHAKIKSIEVVDDLTARFKTDGPYPLFVERLTAQVMQSEKVIKEKGHEWMQENPVGTGPYKLVKWSKKQEHLLVRNEDYWGPKPAFKYVRIRIIPEQATQIAELISGGVDIIKAVPPDQMDVINKSGQARTATSPILRTAFIQLDQAGRSGPNPFQDRRVRQAANLAVDVDSIIKHVLNGLGDRVATTVNPMAFGFDPGLKPYKQDIAQAKKLLAEAGFPNGLEVGFMRGQPTVEPGVIQTSDAIVADLAKAGIRTKARMVGEVGPDVRVVVGLLLDLRHRRDPLRRDDVQPAVQCLLQQGAGRPGHPGPLHARPQAAHRDLCQGPEAHLRRRGLPVQVGAARRVGHQQPGRVRGPARRGRPDVGRDAAEEVGEAVSRAARAAAPDGERRREPARIRPPACDATSPASSSSSWSWSSGSPSWPSRSCTSSAIPSSCSCPRTRARRSSRDTTTCSAWTGRSTCSTGSSSRARCSETSASRGTPTRRPSRW
jgi:peptide/nickel transport system substrate-binding protein